ncbi:Uncharacterised protein [Mycolicibacterium vanbaalenii]|uniref:DUF7159 domain-containing protein n=1 Tax=Mycolicibacterium vanbaalenii TaxID=110539 RepID=A0A5S9QNW4_MYCVN|nr:hypothetical protein [Mycolicibacterium vanbaalenii]CAA0120835.1 Uncharacterised protein [Mycolicibacterium vanbaalenii]
MRAVLGLSVTVDELAWVLADAADGTVLDHDALRCGADAEVACAAARGAQTIAQACGYELDRVGLTWSEDVHREGLRLRTGLGCLGVCDAEAVPMATATTLGRRSGDLAPRLMPAYGAALALVTSHEASSTSAAQPVPKHGHAPRRRTISAMLGMAAAAVVGALCLSAGAAPPDVPAGTAADPPAPSDSGWESVPAPPGPAAEVVRKVVSATPSYSEQPAAVPVQTYAPVQTHVPVPAAAVPTPEPTVAAAQPAPAEQPHLTGTQLAVGPAPGPTAPVSPPPPDAEMTELVNVFTAWP